MLETRRQKAADALRRIVAHLEDALAADTPRTRLQPEPLDDALAPSRRRQAP
jgi:hypothetical protein